MKFIKKVIPSFSVALAGWFGIIWSMLEKDSPIFFSSNEFVVVCYNDFIYPARHWVFSIIILFLTIAPELFINWKKRNNNLLKELLELMLKEVCCDSGDQTRITIFMPTNSFIFSLKYCWLSFFRNIKRHFKKSLLGAHCKCYPTLFGSLLAIYARAGQPYSRGTTTFFRIPEHKEEVDSIASEVYFKQSLVYKKLPDLKDYIKKANGIKKIEDIKPKKAQDEIKKYMGLSHIESFDKLRMLHRRSIYFCGTPITNTEGKIIGSIVIDSTKAGQDFESIEFKKTVLLHTRVIESVINANI